RASAVLCTPMPVATACWPVPTWTAYAPLWSPWACPSSPPGGLRPTAISPRWENSESKGWSLAGRCMKARWISPHVDEAHHPVSGRPGRETMEGVVRRTAEAVRSEEHTSELQSRFDLVCRLLLEKKKRCTLITSNTPLHPSPGHRFSCVQMLRTLHSQGSRNGIRSSSSKHHHAPNFAVPCDDLSD